ncbi:YchJ family metal-binding protein [Micromonospora sp. BRA006-A]|nr:YchJ family metal-binding protein [Micromonospora sp. BRA006-A]
MRSRFSAFALGDAAYLLHGWHHHPPRPPGAGRGHPLEPAGDRGDRSGRPVRQRRYGPVPAHYREDGRAGVLAERSRFAREDGRWVYLDALPSDAARRAGSTARRSGLH